MRVFDFHEFFTFLPDLGEPDTPIIMRSHDEVVTHENELSVSCVVNNFLRSCTVDDDSLVLAFPVACLIDLIACCEDADENFFFRTNAQE